MEIGRLKRLEAEFLERYPGGFDGEELKALVAKHRKGKLEEEARERFGPGAFGNPVVVCEGFGKFVSKSTVISLFEKPKLREAVADFGPGEQAAFARALRDRLHGDAREGFEAMTRLLAARGLAKWSLLTVVPAYYAPQSEVFVKPTVAKAVVAAFGLPLTYKAAPNWAFYEGFRAALNAMKAECDPCLSPSSMAFSGFLMMALGV